MIFLYYYFFSDKLYISILCFIFITISIIHPFYVFFKKKEKIYENGWFKNYKYKKIINLLDFYDYLLIVLLQINFFIFLLIILFEKIKEINEKRKKK